MPPRHKDSLARRKYKQSPKLCFWIFTEGKNTEPDYFGALCRAFPNALIRLEVRHSGDPMKCVEDAESKKRQLRRSRNSFDAGDQVCVVFDRDTWACFDDVIARCRRLGILIGSSNPCFELWLILHREEFNKPCDGLQAQRHFEKLCPDYDRSRTKTMDFGTLVMDVEKAEERARRLLARREEEGNPHGVPSTTVHELTEAIRKASKAWTG